MAIKAATIRLLLSGDLVDGPWYIQHHKLPPGTSALSHFLTSGWRRKRAPNPFFDPQWYLETNPEVAAARLDPLSHYIEYGEAEGRWPCRLFDPAWYAKANGVPLGHASALKHYMHVGVARGLRPNEFFDPQHYLERNPDLPQDIAGAPTHYLSFGYAERRQVSAEFDAPWYRKHYRLGAGLDAIHHFVTVGRGSEHVALPQDFYSVANEVRRFSAPGPEFENLDPSLIRLAPARAKAIAFYLPQFHAIPENDQWWGTGFTEWRNICRGNPRFVGHYQPRVPRDLGFYDLSDPLVMRRQVDLAKAAGIYGFCFYYYQFGEKQVLEKPLERLLADPSLDMPFCLMWANENWTRRWDGLEAEVLLEQHYDEDSDRKLVANMARAMADPRYIRVAGRPLFIVYRPGIVPAMRERAARWRELFREHGMEPWLLMAQAFQDQDPTLYGLDGAVEFPPHKLTGTTTPVGEALEVLDPLFNATVYEYDDIVDSSLAEPEPHYPLIKTAVPSWDNDARRQGTGTTFKGSTPAAYQRWMEALVERAQLRGFAGEPLVFVNAWNEWAEGAYLEPDLHFGSAYLNATARALVGSVAIDAARKPHILLVGHDAHEHGAQMTLLNLGRCFTQRFGVRVTFLLLGSGKLLPEYEKVGDVVVFDPRSALLEATIDELVDKGIGLAITNTVVTGVVVPELKRRGVRVVSLVHELPRLIREFGVENAAGRIAQQSDVVVFADGFVRDAFQKAVAPVSGECLILPQGLYAGIDPQPDARASVREELGLPADARIVVGIGYADLRKGIDLFFETARQAAASDPDLIFLWVGRLEPAVSVWLAPDDDNGGLPANVRHVGFTPQVGRYLLAADAFYLTSREDPFPSTVIEALACGLPLVGFAGRTGTEGLIRRFGQVVPAFDNGAALAALRAEIAGATEEKAEARRAAVAAEFRWEDYAFRLLQQLRPGWKRISVVVPNYNYARYLEERLDSIFRQTVPVYEVIVLDDASTDDSLAVIERVARERNRTVRVVANAANSGAIMKQWAKAAREASGDLLWIAEADDGAAPNFLARLGEAFGPATLMAFSDSQQIDADGTLLARSYDYYFRRFHGDAFRQDFEAGAAAFAGRYLATSNIILNVSSVLFRREALVAVFDRELPELQSYRFAGDWLVYLALCRMAGDVAFRAEPLNVHRRHGGSATHQTALEAHVAEVARIHEAFDRLFEANAAIRDAQQAYRDELRAQFGLAPEDSGENLRLGATA